MASVNPLTADPYQSPAMELRPYDSVAYNGSRPGTGATHTEDDAATNPYDKTSPARESTITRRSSRSSGVQRKSAPPPTVPAQPHPQGPPKLVPFDTGFFDKSPEATAARSQYMKTVFGGTLMIVVIIFAVFPIFWGASWKTSQYIHNINAFVVDFDGKQIGNATLSALQNPQFQSPHFISFQVQDPAHFPGGPADLQRAIADNKAWVGIAVMPQSTDKLQAALAGADASYDGSRSIVIYTAEARSEGTFRNAVRPQVEQIFSGITQKFAQQFAKNIAGSQNLQTVLTNAPQIITQPIGFYIDNFTPFDIPVASAVVFVGLIYLLVLSLMVTMLLAGAREASGYERGLNFRSLVGIRMLTPIFMYFVVSLFYTLLSYAFGIKFDRRFGRAGFVIFWALQWIGMLALGFAIEAVLTLLTIRGIPLFIILWIITNVSTCFVPIEMLPGVFKYGYAWPFFNISQAARSIIFGVKNELGQNFGILIAWVALSCATIPFFVFITRRRQVKEHRALYGEQTVGQAL